MRKEYLFRWLKNQSNLPLARERLHGFVFNIGGANIEITTQNLRIADFVRIFFCDYESKKEPQLSVFISPFPNSTPDLWEDEDAEFDSRDDVVVQRDFIAKTIEPNKVVAWISPEVIEDAIHNLLRWLLPNLLLQESAFLLHSASVVSNQRGYIFFGQSGVGKSTSVDLIKSFDDEVTLLGDDACIIQFEKHTNKAWLYSAPVGCGYSRKAPRAMRVPLGAMFSLSQSEAHQIKPLTTSEAMSCLLASVMSKDFNELVERKFDLAQSFATCDTKINRLEFAKDPGFWKLIKGDDL